MEAFYGWIRSLTGYFLFMMVLEQLLPGKKYGKYIRLFAGMVWILLILQPFTGSLRIDEKMALAYERSVFRYQADELKEELLGIGEKQRDQMIGRYEEAVAVDLKGMAENEGFSVSDCSVTIGRDENQETYGKVTEVSMKVLGEGDALFLDAGRLRRKIAAYYDLEEKYVEIQIVERKG